LRLAVSAACRARELRAPAPQARCIGQRDGWQLQARQRTCRTPNDGDALKAKVVEQLDHSVSLIFQ
jgi:hypothetical protein